MSLPSVINTTAQPILRLPSAENNPMQQARAMAGATEQLLQTLPVEMQEAFRLISTNLEKLPPSHPVKELKKGLVLLTGEFAKLAGFSPELSAIFELLHRPEGSSPSQAEKKAASKIFDVVSALNQKIMGNPLPLNPDRILVDQYPEIQPKAPQPNDGQFICRHYEEK